MTPLLAAIAAQAFTCHATALHDVDGPIHCADGRKVRLQGIGATEMDGTCRLNQPCVPGDPRKQRRIMAEQVISARIAREDGWAQRGGVDRVLTLSCGRTDTVDEKIRGEDWDDILLEQWSDEARCKPGWAQKPLACGFIAYGFAWRMHGREWIPSYGQRRALNPGYVSVGVPVPRQELMDAIVRALVIM